MCSRRRSGASWCANTTGGPALHRTRPRFTFHFAGIARNERASGVERKLEPLRSQIATVYPANQPSVLLMARTHCSPSSLIWKRNYGYFRAW
ncbi:phage terminase large subunit-like protein [Pacificimonas flava]|nr:phage terminase large subunit-like protein [Pacificimonas flava]